MPLPIGPIGSVLSTIQTLGEMVPKIVDRIHEFIHRNEPAPHRAHDLKGDHVDWEEQYTQLIVHYQNQITLSQTASREENLALREDNRVLKEHIKALETLRQGMHESVSLAPELALPDVKTTLHAIHAICSRRHEHYTASAQGLVHQGMVFLSVAHIPKRHVFALAVQGNDPTIAQVRYHRLPAEIPFRYRVDWNEHHWEKAVAEGVRRFQDDPTQFNTLSQPGLNQMLTSLDQHIASIERFEA